ncbi:DoxX family membrane protein [Spirosoma sp. HMF4905]|uniref:DoxX family membrane protein n=1 Tax=Spirosoma arboris TaxID=2682092 RepID=A0A7K1SHR3_9BACT|nr:DoxX family protein [Spirosoma arboris]MVM33293.1 DoxX family membrane protein [Spirosoma arboris]
MFQQFISTRNDLAGLFLRLPLGTVMLYHGLQKAAGWFGGYGFAGTMQFFTDTVHIPWIIGFLTIVIETVGAVGLLVGFLGRINALGTFAVMLGALLTTHLPFGFSMNWFGNQHGEGIEMHLLSLGMSFALVVLGSGRYSIDRLFTRSIKPALATASDSYPENESVHQNGLIM